MSTRYSISFATVVLLVLLRLNIGWHFFSEGMKHYTDPHWTSEATLRAATGPLAGWYHAYLPDFHAYEHYLHQDMSLSEQHAVDGWIGAIGNDWEQDRQRFVAHYGLDEAGDRRTKAILAEKQQALRSWANANKDALIAHVHQWRRTETKAATPVADVPFEKQRLDQRQGTLAAEAKGWLAELKSLESDYDNALSDVLSDEQRERKPLARVEPSIATVDSVMTYGILAIGALLLVGLFTRAACLAGAAFLFSVVMMQPFWVSDALPTYNQFVEMFALLALATTAVGRWCGLDFFVHQLVVGKNESKGRSDVLES